jgi:hypothetical protein
MAALKGELHRKLQAARAALLSGLEGLGEYDLRRPMTSTGTNLLGLVKHLAGLEYGYLGESLGRVGLDEDSWRDYLARITVRRPARGRRVSSQLKPMLQGGAVTFCTKVRVIAPTRYPARLTVSTRRPHAPSSPEFRQRDPSSYQF